MSFLYYLILIVLIIYIYSYYNYPRNISIIQTNLDRLNYDMLLEKQPLVIENNKTDLDQLKDNLFNMTISCLFYIEDTEEWQNNRYKYLVIQSIGDCEILIYSPFKKIIDGLPDNNEKLINIQIKNGQSLILPFHWKYYIEKNNKFNCLGIHNLITYFLP